MISKYQDSYPAGRYKNIHQVPRAEVKTVQRLLICLEGTRAVQYQVVHDPHRGSWPRHRESPRMGKITDCSPYILCLALVQCRVCTDSIPDLRLLI